MTREQWMNYPPEEVTYTDSGQPALWVYCQASGVHEKVTVKLCEEEEEAP